MFLPVPPIINNQPLLTTPFFKEDKVKVLPLCALAKQKGYCSTLSRTRILSFGVERAAGKDGLPSVRNGVGTIDPASEEEGCNGYCSIISSTILLSSPWFYFWLQLDWRQASSESNQTKGRVSPNHSELVGLSHILNHKTNRIYLLCLETNAVIYSWCLQFTVPNAVTICYLYNTYN